MYPPYAAPMLVTVLARLEIEGCEASARDVLDKLDDLVFGPTYRANARGDLHRFKLACSDPDPLGWVRRQLENRGLIVRELYINTHPLES